MKHIHYIRGEWNQCCHLDHDAGGNLVHYTDIHGHDIWYGYDSKGNRVHEKHGGPIQRNCECWKMRICLPAAATNTTHMKIAPATDVA